MTRYDLNVAANPTFVLVGHCGADMHMMKNAVARAVPGAAVAAADDEISLHRHLTPGAVLLINRVLDGGFETDSGIDLIERLAKAGARPVMLLVSNLPEAQERAVAAGARAGFGKRDLYSTRTAALLREAAADRA